MQGYQCKIKRVYDSKFRDLSPMTLFTAYDVLYFKLGDLSEVYDKFENKHHRPGGAVAVHTGKVSFFADDCNVQAHPSTLTY